MSDEKNLNDDLNDMLDDAKEGAKKAADKAGELANEAKESASDFAESAKEIITSDDNKKMLVGLVAIFLGWLGIHKFILGYKKEGIILLSISVVGCLLSCFGIGIIIVWATGIIGLIEGIIYLTKSDEEFYNTYQAGQKPWF
jgi:TM2 domain-containing membrane protein YozV